MTFVVSGRIEMESGNSAQVLQNAAAQTRAVGDAARVASGGAAALTAATDQLGSAQSRSGQAARNQAAGQQESTRAIAANTAMVGRQRAAYQQLGFQVQDIFQQFALGINPLVILAQQGGQVTSAFAMMGDAQDGAKSKFTRFMTFLSGPYGAAIFGVVTILGFMIAKLFESGDAHDRATSAADSLAEAQSALGKIFDLQTGKIKANTEALQINTLAAAINLKVKAQQAKSDDLDAINDVGLSLGRLLDFSREGLGDPYGKAERERKNADRVRGILTNLRDDNLDGQQALSMLERLKPSDFDGLNIDKLGALELARSFSTADYNLTNAQDTIDSIVSGKLNPRFRKESDAKPKRKDNSAEKAAREAERLAEFGALAAERIQRLNEQFDKTPRFIDQANQSIRELDALQVDIADRFAKQPEKVAEFNAAIAKTRSTIQAAMLEPYAELERSGERQLEQLALIAQGRDSEAEALQRIIQFEERYGDLTTDQRAAVLAQVEAEKELNRVIEERGVRLSIYYAALDDARGALEDLLSGGNAGDFLDNMQSSFKRLQGRLLTEQIFGPVERRFEEFLTGRTGLKSQIDDLAKDHKKAGDASEKLASVMDDAASAIAAATMRIKNPELVLTGPDEGGNIETDANGETVIVAEGTNPITDPGAREVFEEIVEGMVGGIADTLDNTFGISFFNQMQGAFAGALSGYAQAGPVGAVLGFAKGVSDIIDGLDKVRSDGKDSASAGAEKTGEIVASKLNQTLGSAFDGAVQGYRNAALLDAMGVKSSKLGGAIGGAIGQAAFGPIGGFVGSIAGSLIGGAFKKTKYGSATITNVDDDASVSGNSGSRKQAAQGLAGSVQDTLRNIADALDADIGSFSVSIGVRKDKFRVDPSGQGNTKKSRGAVDFGKDEAAAIAYATMDAILDGALEGVSDKVQRALRSNSDIDRALKEALKVKDVEELLEGIAGSIEREVRDFEKQANERLRIARQYGFDILEIERINAEERTKLVEDILSDRVGALQELLEDLAFGDLAEGTLTERRARLIEEIATAQADAEAGVDGAADRLASLNRRLVDLSRDAFGTAGSEYAADREQAIASAQRVIEIETERVRAAQEAVDQTNAHLAAGNVLADEANDLLAEINAAVIRLGRGGVVITNPGQAGVSLDDLVRSVQLR